MKDFFKIGIEGKEGEDKDYVRNMGWWLVHRPIQWFFWLGFVITVAIPMGIGFAIERYQDRKKK